MTFTKHQEGFDTIFSRPTSPGADMPENDLATQTGNRDIEPYESNQQGESSNIFGPDQDDV